MNRHTPPLPEPAATPCKTCAAGLCGLSQLFVAGADRPPELEWLRVDMRDRRRVVRLLRSHGFTLNLRGRDLPVIYLSTLRMAVRVVRFRKDGTYYMNETDVIK